MEVNYEVKVRGFDGGGKVINDTDSANKSREFLK